MEKPQITQIRADPPPAPSNHEDTKTPRRHRLSEIRPLYGTGIRGEAAHSSRDGGLSQSKALVDASVATAAHPPDGCRCYLIVLFVFMRKDDNSISPPY